MRKSRSGLTLIEVIVAILLFSVGALGLAASSAAITRQMTLSLLRSRSATIARSRNEKAQSLGCSSLSGGFETEQGIRSTWSVTSGGSALIDQRLERNAGAGIRTDHFYSAISCE